MRIIDWLSELTSKYNTENKCGFCWHFVHARHDFANLYKPTEDKKCCVHIFLESIRRRKHYDIDHDLRQSNITHIDYTLELFIGFNSKYDIMYHNELRYPEDESKFEKYIRPIADCMDDFEIDLCQDDDLMITDMQEMVLINYKDQNYDGLKIILEIRNFKN